MEFRTIAGLVALGCLTIVAALGSGCGDRAAAPGRLVRTEVSKIVSLRLEPDALSLHPGDTVMFRALGEDKEATLLDVTNDVDWLSSDELGMTVKPGGWVKLNKPGDFTVTVRHPGGLEGRAIVNVRPVVDGGLQSLSIVTPTTVFTGDTLALAAMANYANGGSADVSAEVTWSASPAERVDVGAGGRLTALAAGSVEITATHPDGPTTATMITIDDASASPAAPAQEVLSISIAAVGRLYVGDNARLTVYGVLENGTAVDVTDQVTWLPSADTFLAVDGLGNVTGLNPGLGSVTALYGAGLTAKTDVLVELADAGQYGLEPAS